MRTLSTAAFVLVIASCKSAPAIPSGSNQKLGQLPTSTAAASQFTKTGRYQEAIEMCHAIAAKFPSQATCEVFGQTSQGRPLLALAISDDGATTPAAAVSKQRPVVLIQAGIHAGEIEGKDAGFAFAIALLTKQWPAAAESLRAATFVFIPVLNPDGHERFTPNNRPNQRGPLAMGFRTTGTNLNLNRDYMKLDSPELRAELSLIKRWHPSLFIDLHTTDGAQFQHDIAVMVAPSVPRPDGLTEVARALSDQLQKGLSAQGHKPLWFYPSFVKDEDPTSGCTVGDPPPRFSHGYAAQLGMLGVLVETHSWRTYQERYQSTLDTLQTVATLAPLHAATWRAAQRKAEQQAAALAGQSVDLLFDTTEHSTPFTFKGYAYKQVSSEISGGTWIQYDETKPIDWVMPLFDQVKSVVTVNMPTKGYIVDGGYAAAIVPLLQAHGIAFANVVEPPGVLQTWRADTFKPAAQSSEGRQRMTVTGSWKSEKRTLSAGAIFISIAQPTARIIAGLFEPTSPDALVGWGFFNSAFEQKEYMEAYVAEQVARQLLTDPTIRAAFDKRIAADPAFAKDPQARLAFFHRLHPSWDERLGLIPVFRVEAK
jgi:hypothetical protein